MRNNPHQIHIAIIYSALLLLPSFLTGCQPQKSASPSGELFPVFGIVLGQTDVEELKKMGEEDDGFYVIHGQKFWVHSGNVFKSMNLVRPRQLPLKWRNMGFDWFRSYDQWLELLEDLGYTITIVEAPHVEMFRGHESFTAEVKAINGTATVPTELNLDFKYSDKTTTSGEGTLYSIDIDIPDLETDKPSTNATVQTNQAEKQELPIHIKKQVSEIKAGGDSIVEADKKRIQKMKDELEKLKKEKAKLIAEGRKEDDEHIEMIDMRASALTKYIQMLEETNSELSGTLKQLDK